jgi:hypothetical protein
LDLTIKIILISNNKKIFNAANKIKLQVLKDFKIITLAHKIQKKQLSLQDKINYKSLKEELNKYQQIQIF